MLLATNAYTSEAEFNADLNSLKTTNVIIKPALRRLDLSIVSRVEPLWWAVASFGYAWTPLLAGPLEKLSEEDREWWRQWLAPQFPSDQETEIDTAQWQEHLQNLQIAYPDFWRKAGQRAVIEKKLLPGFAETSTWENRLRNINIVLSQDAIVSAMTKEVFESSTLAAMGKAGGTLCYNYEQRTGFVRLLPHSEKSS